jgi:hypothetical protein
MEEEIMRTIKHGLLLTPALLAFIGPFGSAKAQTVITGRPVEVYADPSDVVIALDTPGNCSNSIFFNVERTNKNFAELTAVVLTAFSTGRSLKLFVASCANGRNIVSHGSVF